ncbi:MAG: hypothetical protein Q9181_006554 [Wetmoreana brouardii]
MVSSDLNSESQSAPEVLRRRENEINQFWRSVVTEEPISDDLKTLVRADLKESWHFHRVNEFHGWIRLDWGGTDSGRLILEDTVGRLPSIGLEYIFNKPTVFYILQSAQYTGNGGHRYFIPGIVFAATFQEWIRSDEAGPDVDFKHFIANPIRVTPTGPATVRGIIDAHRSLCTQASDLSRQAEGRSDSFAKSFTIGRREHYSLLPLYRAIVVIVDENWEPPGGHDVEPDGLISLHKVAQKQTVLIARTGVEEDLSAPVSFESLREQSLPVGTPYTIPPDIDVVRIPLAVAVQFIVELEKRESLAYPKTRTETSHDRFIDPIPPKEYEGNSEVCKSPELWVNATLAAAEKYGYDNVPETWESIRRVQAKLRGEDFRKLEHLPFSEGRGVTVQSDRMRYVDVSTHNSDDVAYQNYGDSNSGLLVCIDNDKEKSGVSKLAGWLAIVKQQQSTPSSLRTILRSLVINEATQRVIWEASRRSTFTREGPDNHRQYTEDDEGFFAILGSINGANTMRMLRDHHAAVGYRTVSRVMIIGKANVNLDKPESHDLVIRTPLFVGLPTSRESQTDFRFLRWMGE